MTQPIENPIVVVTGGGSGIGRATSIAMAAQGFDIRIFDLSPEGAEETLDLVRGAGGTGAFSQVDVSDTES